MGSNEPLVNPAPILTSPAAIQLKDELVADTFNLLQSNEIQRNILLPFGWHSHDEAPDSLQLEQVSAQILP